MNTCDTCRFWKKAEVGDYRLEDPPASEIGFGDCESLHWKAGYGWDEDSELTPSSVLVENDEGWAKWVGPKFGCVHWEQSDKA